MPSQPTCNFSARIDAELYRRFSLTVPPGTAEAVTNRQWLEAQMRHWLTLTPEHRPAPALRPP